MTGLTAGEAGALTQLNLQPMPGDGRHLRSARPREGARISLFLVVRLKHSGSPAGVFGPMGPKMDYY